ncbi:MAG: GNAT family N-acetyltransferase [Peptococcaceae bacterium]|nr:GNAT family N-acetyltransferase [Peptococcaceae bacterium]
MRLTELWTANEFRRRGVAELLMEKAIETARELQLWKVRLYVGTDNPAARGFYKKMGFVEDDTEAMFCNYGGRLN